MSGSGKQQKKAPVSHTIENEDHGVVEFESEGVDNGAPEYNSSSSGSSKKKHFNMRNKTQEARHRANQSSKLLLLEESGYLEAEGMEKTYKYKQSEIVKNVDISSARKNFELTFEKFGPYHVNYTRNGRHILIGGKKGHVGAFDWQSGKLSCELHLGETVRDVQWLHNETMFAVAQRKHVYIYDNKGLELHKLKNHTEVSRLEFLPYHFLLTTIGATGYLRYHDTSTGNLLTEIRTKLGPCEVMTQNPTNAIIHLGHSNGTVTYWSPNMHTPLVKMLCHTGPVKAVAVDPRGMFMVTSGLDGLMKVWDVRNYKSIYTYTTPTPATTITISQKGLLGVGYGPHVQIWKDVFREKQKSPYLNHLLPGSPVTDLQFCPFEDVLGIGHTKGFTSILVPGSGEPNFDALEANPFQTKKQRGEAEVKSLLDKIQPEMIALDPTFVGSIQKPVAAKIESDEKKEFEANNPGKEFKPRNKTRGRNTAVKKYLKKRRNVIDQKRLDIQAEVEKKQQKRERAESDADASSSDPLSRFTKKSKF